MSGITKAAAAALAAPLLVASYAALPAFAAEQPAGGLALKRVLLSTGGVGYFEHEARVSGDAALTLEVRRDQVDDVLKSIVVYDDRGGVGTVDLAGQEPLETAFRELPFTPDDLASPTALLNALKGAEVRAAGSRDLSGRLLSVTEEAVQLPNGVGVTTRHRVSLMTAEGLRQLVLEDTDSLRFADPRVQAQLDKALAAVADSAGKERRRLTIRMTAPKDNAGAERTVRVAYVVGAPLWKATYRLTLPEVGAGAKTGNLQGWAVLENLSGDDWNGVELSVASGNPVTFRQALYSAYFVNRPEVPVEVLGRVLPTPDEGAIAADRMAKAEAPMPRARTGGGMAPPVAMAAPMAPSPGASMGADAPPPAPLQMPKPLPPNAAEPFAAESSEATAQVLFRYPQPVTLVNGGTLMMPIVARAVPAERLSLYQPGTQPRNPLAALRLTNDSAAGSAAGGGGSGLPPGVLTLYETVGGAPAYVGDARLAALPSGESRLLSFAVDQAVTVDRSDQPSRTLSRASLADGVLQLTVTERQTTTYRIAGAVREDRSVIVEHPRRPGWDLVEPANAAPDTTANAYRLPVSVPAGKTATLAVALERPRVERIGLADLAPEQVLAYAASAELPAPVREALGKVAALRTTVAEKERRVADIEREQADIAKEQERLRQNLSTLPRDSDLFKRTIGKMGEQETRLDALSRDLGAARKEADAARAGLRDQVRGMKF
ncbi:DUF4139 domain-containing protein [Azospirillum rugosum]|uniref:DUF4139 domain-containing protein n=1 Tax=Azospirillum rugosum TaxID=416170 RepID=A0ABS4SS53_9PROT|nr:DUF4139 domain-containing protein [Azospirillum rugosum]MBP2295272.1 hypothetical protein [Azospirillum rugosum]MDQ0528647.1 hypothetical protein [Azospirillum rugosum]